MICDLLYNGYMVDFSVDKIVKTNSMINAQHEVNQQIGLNGIRLAPFWNLILQWVRKWCDIVTAQDIKNHSQHR